MIPVKIQRFEKYPTKYLMYSAAYQLFLYNEDVGMIKASEEEDNRWRSLDCSKEEKFKKIYLYQVDQHKTLTAIFGENSRTNINYELAEFMNEHNRIPTKKEWEKLKVLDSLKK